MAVISRDADLGSTTAFVHFPKEEALFLAAVDDDLAAMFGEFADRIVHLTERDLHMELLLDEDGLSTPARIGSSVDDLPGATTFGEVRGADHAVFGDDGSPAGDGPATTPRADAQRQIRASSIDLLDRVDAGP